MSAKKLIIHENKPKKHCMVTQKEHCLSAYNDGTEKCRFLTQSSFHEVFSKLKFIKKFTFSNTPNQHCTNKYFVGAKYLSFVCISCTSRATLISLLYSLMFMFDYVVLVRLYSCRHSNFAHIEAVRHK